MTGSLSWLSVSRGFVSITATRPGCRIDSQMTGGVKDDLSVELDDWGVSAWGRTLGYRTALLDSLLVGVTSSLDAGWMDRSLK